MWLSLRRSRRIKARPPAALVAPLVPKDAQRGTDMSLTEVSAEQVTRAAQNLAVELDNLGSLMNRHIEVFDRVREQRDELLAALKAVMHGGVCECDKCATAQAAIAKAEGR